MSDPGARLRELAAMPYHEYLLTPEWKVRADAAKERAGHRCQVCNGRRLLEAHHRTYERRGHEEEGDLTVLCDPCHELYHKAGKLPAHPREIGVVQRVPGAELWTLPAFTPETMPPVRRRPPLRVLRRTRRRWRETSSVVRIGLALLVAGVAMLAVLSRVPAT